MKHLIVYPSSDFNISITPPPDKSMSHRGLMLASMAQGTSVLHNCLLSIDTQSTINCLQTLGIAIEKQGTTLRVIGKGINPWCDIVENLSLNFGNSGTTARLMLGILTGQPFIVRVDGDASLRQRPMQRVLTPLALMGGLSTPLKSNYLPFSFQGTQQVQPLQYELPVHSAQLKSALLLAGLYAKKGITTLSGAIHSRNHTEMMLKAFNAPIKILDDHIQLSANPQLESTTLRIPGDPSSAAFWVTACLLKQRSFITVHNVSLNPTRLGFYYILKRMQAPIEMILEQDDDEPRGMITACSNTLLATTVHSHEIPFCIDEVPLIMLLATQAKGVTHIHGAQELRKKETDRIKAMTSGLEACGCTVYTNHDSIAIPGEQTLLGGTVNTLDDHRIAMCFAIAGTHSKDPIHLINADCVNVSYPNFYKDLEKITDIFIKN